MYTIDILCVLPEMLTGFLEHSILKRAQEKRIAQIRCYPLRDFATGNYRHIDDYAYGGNPGMVLMPEPLAKAIDTLMEQTAYDEIIYLCPDGVPLKQSHVNQLSLLKNILLLCGKYKGIDERIRQRYVTREISIGDYVLSGGELAASVLADAIVRVLPGAIGDEISALTDSFQDGLLAPPVYTRPASFRGMDVPAVLLKGNHKNIEEWQYEQALQKTKERRPDLLSPSESIG